MPARIRVGTASWTDHEPFYPPEYTKKAMQTQRLSYYARFFDLVEVDATFYHMMSPKVVQGWVDRVSAARADLTAPASPPDSLWEAPSGPQTISTEPSAFIFDVKAYGELTWHHRDEQKQMIAPSAETFQAFSAMLQPLRDADRLGAVLFQFPPWYTFDEERLDYFATIREMLPHDTIAVEFRHRSWVEGERLDETRAALEANQLAYCAVDEPQIGSGSVPPVVLLTDPHYAMVRFHGRNTRMWYSKGLTSSRDRFDYLYTRDELAPWAERIHQMADQLAGSEVHVVANNNASNYGIVNALDLQLLLGQEIGQGQPLPDPVLETMRQRESDQS